MSGSNSPVDVLELGVAGRMLRPFACLAVRLQAVALRLQQSPNSRWADLVALRRKSCRKRGGTLARVPQRTCWFAAGHRVNEPIQRLRQAGVLLGSSFSPATRPALPPGLERLVRLEFANSFANRSIANACRLGDGSYSAAPKRTRFGGSPTPPRSLVQVVDKIRELCLNPVNNDPIWHAATMKEIAARTKANFGLLF